MNLTEIAIVALAALGCGLIFERFRQPAVLGYILAGILLGPSILGVVENRENVSILAELGVLMLLFLIGMELNLQAFKKVWHIAVLCTLGQLAGSFAVVFFAMKLFDLPFGLAVLLGCAIGLSSTAVAVKMLEGLGKIHSETGRLTIGVLIAQDLAIVPMIVILKGLGGGGFDQAVFLKLFLSMGFLAVLIWYIGRRERIHIPFTKIVAGNEDLTPLASLAFCFGLASASGLFGLSAAYGAFLAGLILGNTAERQKMMENAKPIQSILMMVFFLSIGLLMDLGFIWDHLAKVVLLMLFISLGKSFLNVGILHALGQPWTRAFLAGLLLAQMGEFSFLLASIADSSGLIDADGNRLVISLAALSLAFSPFWLAGARRLSSIAPRSRESFHNLLNLAYGREIDAVSRAYRKCVTTSRQSARWVFKKWSGSKHTSQDAEES